MKVHLLPVLLGQLLLLLAALGLLLDGGDDPPGAPPRSHHVLVRHGQQVPLLQRKTEMTGDVIDDDCYLVRELGSSLGDRLHGGSHVVVSLGLGRENTVPYYWIS